jgi:DNA polymerase III, alpha subunit
MSFANVHIHSAYSYDGTASISAIMRNTPLSVIAITDHDTVRGVHAPPDHHARAGGSGRQLRAKQDPFIVHESILCNNCYSLFLLE